MRRICIALTWCLCTVVLAAPAPQELGRFEYDPADETVRAARIGDEHSYDPHVAAIGDRLWLTWLQFEPGKGDRIWIGCRDAKGGDWLSRTATTPEPGIYKNPTLTVDPAGGLWLSYERQQGELWFVEARPFRMDRTAIAAVATAPAGKPGAIVIGKGINHRVAADTKDGIWVAYQHKYSCSASCRFHLDIAQVSGAGQLKGSPPDVTYGADAWAPDITVLPDGDVYVVFDAYSPDTGFDTYICHRHDGEWSPARVLNATEAFEARARVVSSPAGRVWTLWEEGNRNWGKPYRPRMLKASPGALEMTDAHGPLHAFRWLRVNELIGRGRSPIDPPLPMSAFDRLAKRPNAPAGVEYLGGYYERGEPAVDGLGRLWVVYRHYTAPWVGIQKISHKQEDWGVYARCHSGKAWSKLFRCDIGQGDGMQRLSVTGLADGIALTYATGRTDRRPSDSPINIVLATIHLPGEPEADEVFGSASELPTRTSFQGRSMPEEKPGYKVFFGDLHRHTDLSLCYVPTDGTMDDAYRYALDVAKLDFLGITDHARDIADGQADSLLWWRCRKEVSRHTFPASLVGMFAYEHSRGGEDHNVVSLRPDLLRPDSMPFPQLWAQMDADTFTIPHQTNCRPIPPSGEMPLGLDGKTWGYGDNAHRRLIEVYQGCRDRVIERDAWAGLAKGHIMGFIASSDHLSTAASYAGVWAEQRTRESIFRAMQARRTFGATANIRLRVMMGPHWMGEQVRAAEVGPVHVAVEGTDAIKNIDLIVDGRVAQSWPQNNSSVEQDINLPPFAASQATSAGIHYFYVRLEQADGNMAWSSPIWVSN